MITADYRCNHCGHEWTEEDFTPGDFHDETRECECGNTVNPHHILEA